MGSEKRSANSDGNCIGAVIEDPVGSTVRHVFDKCTGSWRTFPHPLARRPWPANYGYLLHTYNPSDDDALDVIVLASQPLPTGSEVLVRPVGLLRRRNGDDKVLAVLCSDPHYREIQTLQEVPPEDLQKILHWFADWESVPEVAGELAAWVAIRVAQERYQERA